MKLIIKTDTFNIGGNSYKKGDIIEYDDITGTLLLQSNRQNVQQINQTSSIPVSNIVINDDKEMDIVYSDPVIELNTHIDNLISKDEILKLNKKQQVKIIKEQLGLRPALLEKGRIKQIMDNIDKVVL